MSTLGKRKERTDHSGPPAGSTLFVSNLPYTATSTDIQTLFSDIAPVRSAFVVLDHESGISKGVGYVSFAIKDDAEAALKKISEEGLVLDRRKLRVQWAENKVASLQFIFPFHFF
jgi:nucleolar protein 4